MKTLMLAAAVFGAGIAGAAHAEGLHIDNAAARVVVIPEARQGVSVTVQQGDARLPPLTVHPDGPGVVIEGGLNRRIKECRGSYTSTPIIGALVHNHDNRAVRITDVGWVEYSALPIITAHVPLDARVGASGAVWGQMGATHSLMLSSLGCGDWAIGDVHGPLTTAQVGSGDIKGGTAQTLHSSISGSGDLILSDIGGEADISVSGSGDVHLHAVHGPLHPDMAGSGDITVASVDGAIQSRIGGSGDVQIRGGQAPYVNVKVAGSGDFTFDGTAGAFSAVVAGSGDVRVAHVTGAVSKTVLGSGVVTVGR